MLGADEGTNSGQQDRKTGQLMGQFDALDMIAEVDNEDSVV